LTDTGTPLALEEDTLRSGRRPRTRRSHSNLLAKLPVSRRTLLIGAAICGGLLLMAAVAAIVITNSLSKRASSVSPVGPGPATARGVLYVSKSRVEPGDYATIREAIEKAGPGDRIVVRDQEVYEENLWITPATGLSKHGLTLEAEKSADGKSATLLAGGVDPILVVERTERFKIKGFTLDGQMKAEDLLRVSGSCPGCVFEDLRLTGFTHNGIRLDGCSGANRHDVIFKEIRVEATPQKDRMASSAVSFGPVGKGSNNANVFVGLQDCRFIGPYQDTVRFAAPCGNVTLERNLFIAGKQKALVVSSDLPPGSALSVRIQNNTFWDYEFGVVVQQTTHLATTIVLRNNLFYDVREGIVTAQKIPPESLEGYLQGEGNIYDPKSKPGNLNLIGTLRVRQENFTLPTASPADTDFLRYPKSDNLATAGEKNAPVGALSPLP
jgi:hypothetical protein